jgi:hypothetical protein
MADWTSDTIPKNIMETLVVDDLAVNYEISAGTIQAKNAATAWVNFDGTTTPPTILDGYNVKDVVRTNNGYFEVYFKEDMKNTNYSISTGIGGSGTSTYQRAVETYSHLINKFTLKTTDNYGSTVALTNRPYNSIQIMGGKN